MRLTPCPLPTGVAVGADEEAVDPPAQGAVQGVDLCVETWIALVTWVHEEGGPLRPQLIHTTNCMVTLHWTCCTMRSARNSRMYML